MATLMNRCVFAYNKKHLLVSVCCTDLSVYLHVCFFSPFIRVEYRVTLTVNSTAMTNMVLSVEGLAEDLVLSNNNGRPVACLLGW
jgi:hypothetical protein